MAAGRPTTYKPEYCEKIVEFCKNGDTLNQFAVSVGTHPQRLYEWAKQNEEFNEALLKARAVYQAYYEKILKFAIHGKKIEDVHKIDGLLLMFKMKSRFSDYHDTQVIKAETDKPITLAYRPKAKRKIQDMNGNDIPVKQLDADVQRV